MNNIRDNSVTIPEYKNRTRKTLEELTIRDDFMFSKVFSKSIERAKYFIELTLGREVAEIRFHKDQYSINDFYNSKGIRLDVLLVGATEWIDVEMQNQGGSDLVQRNQYYTSLMTVDSLETGLDYDKLPRIITIFITGFDPFGLGYEKYICLENLYGELPSGIKNDVTQEANYDGRCVKIYLNVSNILPTYRTSSEELRNVLDYFRTSNPTGKFALELNEGVASAKKDANVRREFMVFEELVKNERNEAKEEGRKEGIAEGKSIGLEEGKSIGLEEGKTLGLEEGKIEVAKKMLSSDTFMSNEMISEFTGLTVKEIEELNKSMK